MNDVLYFAFDDGKDETGKELWRTDGTADGTYLVKDIREGSNGYDIDEFVIYDNHIYFGARNESGDYSELWKSDGTEEGTVQISNLNLNPRYMTVFNDEIYFNGRNEDGDRLVWKSDGTGEGTAVVGDSVYVDGEFFAFGDHLYFKGYSVAHGIELWRTDGTDEGTGLVKDIRPGSSSSSEIKGIPEATRGCRSNCYPTFLFLFHPIHGGCTIMYFTDLVIHSGVIENALCSSGFTSVNMGHDADIACFF